jgi:uncharacterized protein
MEENKVAEESVAADDRSDTIPSPCIGICELDGQSRLCRGCLRSGDEIAAWRSASDPERRQILERVRKRSEEASAPEWAESRLIAQSD